MVNICQSSSGVLRFIQGVGPRGRQTAQRCSLYACILSMVVVELALEGASVTVAQNTEGRVETGNAMLHLSVSGLNNVGSVGG